MAAPLTAGQGRSSGTVVNVTVTSADPQAVVDALRRYVRTNGPVPVKVA
jgi:predicted secreted protein